MLTKATLSPKRKISDSKHAFCEKRSILMMFFGFLTVIYYPELGPLLKWNVWQLEEMNIWNLDPGLHVSTASLWFWVLQRSRDNDELVRTVHDQQCRKVQAKLRKCRHQNTARKTLLQAGTAKIATSVKSMLRKYLAKADSFRWATWHRGQWWQHLLFAQRMDPPGMSWMWRNASHPGMKGDNAHIRGRGLS